MTFTTATGMAKLVQEAKKNRMASDVIALSQGMKVRTKTFKKIPIVVDKELSAGTMELRGPNMSRVRIEGVE